MATKKTKTTAKKVTPSSRKKKISSNDIQIRAQQIYSNRIREGIAGDDLSDWLQAEKELKTV
jgi:hypothetical protein